MAPGGKKTIVVTGATGNQGSSVARTFLELENWHVRAVTRDPTSPAAKALAAQGAEVVQADFSDVNSLDKAFENANAIFVNTDFWQTFRAAAVAESTGGPSASDVAFETEVKWGKNAALAAAKVSTLERFVYSALPPLKKPSGGKYWRSAHWESKNSVVEFIKDEVPDLSNKTSVIILAAYNTNPNLVPVIDPATGLYSFISPWKESLVLQVVDPRKSTGPFVQALIEDAPAGITFFGYDETFTVGELAGMLSRATGKDVKPVQKDIDTIHRERGIPMEFLDAFGFMAEYGYPGPIKVTEPAQLKVKVEHTPFKDFLKQKDWKALLGPK